MLRIPHPEARMQGLPQNVAGLGQQRTPYFPKMGLSCDTKQQQSTIGEAQEY